MQLSSLVRRVAATGDSFAPTIIRVALGLMILPHGLQKTVGWFGGYGFQGTMQFLTGTFGAPWIFAFLAIMAESVGAVMLIAGIGTRLAAIGMTGVMLVASTQHWQHGFFMNWYGNQGGEGIEFFILAIGMALALLLSGGGKLSLDRKLQHA